MLAILLLGVALALDHRCWPNNASVVMLTLFDAEPAHWATLRRNRLVVARLNGYDYCEYRAAVGSSVRAPAWQKLGAIQHALFELNYAGVWWIDYDAYAPKPRKRTFASLLAPLKLDSLECVLSGDIGSTKLDAINSGLFYLARSEWTRRFLAAVAGPGDRATSKKCPPTWYEQCALRWYVDQHRSEFAWFPRRGSAGSILQFGTLQSFPHLRRQHKIGALFYHYAGAIKTPALFAEMASEIPD